MRIAAGDGLAFRPFGGIGSVHHIWNRRGGQYADDEKNYHQLDKRETLFSSGIINIITIRLSRNIHSSPPCLLAEENGGGRRIHKVGVFTTPTL